MMFPWFLLALRLKHGGLCKKAALGKWEGKAGGRVPPGERKMGRIKRWELCKTTAPAFIRKAVRTEVKLLFTLRRSWGPPSLTVTNVDKVFLVALWVSEGPNLPWTRSCRLREAQAASLRSALWMPKTNCSCATRDSLHLGNIQKSEGLLLGSEEL